MPTSLERRIESLIRETLEAEQAHLDEDNDEPSSKPGKPAKEASIRAAEKARGVEFPDPYRAFLSLHDGWNHFSYGTNLLSTKELSGKSYAICRESIVETARHGKVPDEVQRALVIGCSENDPSLVLLLESGAVLDWEFEELGRYGDFIEYLSSRKADLASLDASTQQMLERARREWEPTYREEQERALRKKLEVALRNHDKKAGAGSKEHASSSTLPKASRPPAAASPTDLVVKKGREVVAEVCQHLVLYLGAYPSPAEVAATYRAFRASYPVRGRAHWMQAHAYPAEHEADSFDDPALEAALVSLAPDSLGYFGLRVELAEGRGGYGAGTRYVLNVRGLPPGEDEGDEDDDQQPKEGTPRASFCEVIVPVSENPTALDKLARELLKILPVRSGHGGYAAYVWDDDVTPDPTEQVFAWTRRFFGVDVGHLEGWLEAAIERARGAAWLTILGKTMTMALKKADRLKFSSAIDVSVSAFGTVLRAGPNPVLADVARGEFPTALAEVERALAPILIADWHRVSTLSIGGRHFLAIENELPGFGSHRATAAFLRRLSHPAEFTGPSARERGEALLERLCPKPTEAPRKEWRAEVKEGSPDFDTLLRTLVTATHGKEKAALADQALRFVLEFDSPMRANAYTKLLYRYLLLGELDRAAPLIEPSLGLAPAEPMLFHNIACVLARQGDSARALEMVKAAISSGYEEWRTMKDDEDLASLRSDASFVALFAPSKGKQSKRAGR